MKKGVIFDLDGTLVDSIPFHFSVHKKVFKKLNINLEKEFFELKCNGTIAKEFYKTILLHYKGDLKNHKKAIELRKESYDGNKFLNIKTFPWVKTTLKNLKKEGFTLVLASSSPREYIKRVLKNNNITHYFDDIVAGDEVKQTKPSPEIFLKAKELTKLKKSDCVVVEDANNGVLAAKRAGIDCICMLTSQKKKEIPKYAKVCKSHKALFNKIKKL